MSLGIGANAVMFAQDADTVIYRYGGYDLNDPAYKNKDRLYDGTITVSRRCIPEPEIHERVKRMPGGKKTLITKRIPVDSDYLKLIENGQIVIENCSNCREYIPNRSIDTMAMHIIYRLFTIYQQEGILPESVSYHV